MDHHEVRHGEGIAKPSPAVRIFQTLCRETGKQSRQKVFGNSSHCFQPSVNDLLCFCTWSTLTHFSLPCSFAWLLGYIYLVYHCIKVYPVSVSMSWQCHESPPWLVMFHCPVPPGCELKPGVPSISTRQKKPCSASVLQFFMTYIHTYSIITYHPQK